MVALQGEITSLQASGVVTPLDSVDDNDEEAVLERRLAVLRQKSSRVELHAPPAQLPLVGHNVVPGLRPARSFMSEDVRIADAARLSGEARGRRIRSESPTGRKKQTPRWDLAGKQA